MTSNSRRPVVICLRPDPVRATRRRVEDAAEFGLRIVKLYAKICVVVTGTVTTVAAAVHQLVELFR